MAARVGRFERSIARIPKNIDVAAAKEQRSQLNMKIGIVNPADGRACAAYARFRQMPAGQRSAATAAAWTADRVRKESYATVLAACGSSGTRWPGGARTVRRAR